MNNCLHDSLLDLVLKHGILSVRTELESICKSLYEDLSSLYGEEAKKEKKVETRGRKKKTESSEPVQEQEKEQEEQEPPQALQPPQPPPQEEPPLKRRIVKKGEKMNILVQKLEEHGGIDEEDKLLLVAEEEPLVETSDPKEQQRLAVEAKRNELLGNGIDPETLLTKENLERWLKSGKTYQRIAKEHVGLHESVVSAKAKEFGLQSNASKYKFIRKKAYA